MKLFYTIIFCLCAIGVHSQINHSKENDGTYLLQKAVFSTYNYNTKGEIDTRVIDPESLEDGEIFYQNVFKEVSIYNHELTFCVLSNNLDYQVTDRLTLIPAKEYNSDKVKSGNIPAQLSPYSLSIENNTATFTVLYLYGDSRYNFPLEGKLTLTLTKQK